MQTTPCQFIEIRHRLDPLAAGCVAISSDTDSGYLRLTITKIPSHDVAYIVEATDDLTSGDWTTTDTIVEVNTDTELRVRDNVLVSDSPARFFRLRVIEP